MWFFTVHSLQKVVQYIYYKWFWQHYSIIASFLRQAQQVLQAEEQQAAQEPGGDRVRISALPHPPQQLHHGR